MSQPIFYAPGAKANSGMQLSEQESHHAVRVLRLQAGDPLWVFDGIGHLYKAHLTAAATRVASIHIGELIRVEVEPPRLHLAFAPAKSSDRNEWVVEKATELGVGIISFLLCERSERRVMNLDKLKAVALAACKQSKHLHLPKLEGLVDFHDFVKKMEQQENLSRFICKQADTSVPLQSVGMEKASVFLIGPEGDFSNKELEAALKANFQSVILTNSRLRTETAAIAAVCAYQFRK